MPRPFIIASASVAVKLTVWFTPKASGLSKLCLSTIPPLVPNPTLVDTPGDPTAVFNAERMGAFEADPVVPVVELWPELAVSDAEADGPSEAHSGGVKQPGRRVA
jgi:hypothetical protein